jgi:hypothetical protein
VRQSEGPLVLAGSKRLTEQEREELRAALLSTEQERDKLRATLRSTEQKGGELRATLQVSREKWRSRLFRLFSKSYGLGTYSLRADASCRRAPESGREPTSRTNRYPQAKLKGLHVKLTGSCF